MNNKRALEKRVLIITYYWPPSGGSGVQRWLKFTKYLKEFGWSPIVLTVDPKKASYFLLDASLEKSVSPSIDVYRTNSVELLNVGAKLFGKKQIAHSGFSNVDRSSKKQKVLRFIRGNMFSVDPRKGWNRYAYRKAVSLINEFSIQHVITTSPPHSTQLIGKKLKQKFGEKINWLADMRDPWTDIFYYKDFLKIGVLERKEKAIEIDVLNKADRIITVSKGLKKIFSSKISQPEKIAIIENGFDRADFKNEVEVHPQNRLEGSFNILYIGVINHTYNITSLFKVLRELIKTYPSIHLNFVGIQSEELKKEVMEQELDKNVSYFPYAQKSALMGYYQQADINLLAIPDILGNQGIITGKIFEYLSVHKPVLGIGPIKGDASFILKETDAGLMFDYHDLEGIKSFITQVMQKTAQFSFKGVEKYSRKSLTKRLVHILEEAK